MDIPDRWYKQKSWMKGDVCSVGDADGIRIRHIPIFSSQLPSLLPKSNYCGNLLMF